jgi:hypothetical protein
MEDWRVFRLHGRSRRSPLVPRAAHPSPSQRPIRYRPPCRLRAPSERVLDAPASQGDPFSLYWRRSRTGGSGSSRNHPVPERSSLGTAPPPASLARGRPGRAQSVSGVRGSWREPRRQADRPAWRAATALHRERSGLPSARAESRRASAHERRPHPVQRAGPEAHRTRRHGSAIAIPRRAALRAGPATAPRVHAGAAAEVRQAPCQDRADDCSRRGAARARPW